MGANIGSTITAWLAIVGFTKIGAKIFALSLIGIIFPFLFSQKSRRKSIGEFVFGFSILLIGLELLKEYQRQSRIDCFHCQLYAAGFLFNIDIHLYWYGYNYVASII